jgi:isocitrate dehydrogenase
MCRIGRFIPFIEGDGTGADIWRSSVRVFDAAVEKAYGGNEKDRLDGSLRGGEMLQEIQQLAARRNGGGVSSISWWASRGRSPRRSAAAFAR